jgi:hypothetical protein
LATPGEIQLPNLSLAKRRDAILPSAGENVLMMTAKHTKMPKKKPTTGPETRKSGSPVLDLPAKKQKTLDLP